MLGFKFLRRNSSSPCFFPFSSTQICTRTHTYTHQEKVGGKSVPPFFFFGDVGKCRGTAGKCLTRAPNTCSRCKSHAPTLKIQRQLCDSLTKQFQLANVSDSVKDKILVVGGMIATLNYRAFLGGFLRAVKTIRQHWQHCALCASSP